MNTHINTTFNNTYKVELIDSRTNEVKKSGVFHNIATSNAYRIFVGLQSGTGEPGGSSSRLVPYNILYRLKCGSGTATPQPSDTNLASPLWSDALFSGTQSWTWISDTTYKGIGVFTIPASAAYVGTVTEVGLYCARAYYNSSNFAPVICTHSLLTDSEGQQISFNKTDIDILKITVSIELSISSSDDNFVIFKHPAALTQFSSSGGLKRYYAKDRYNYYGNIGPIYLNRYNADSTNASSNYDNLQGGVTAYPNDNICDATNYKVTIPKVRIPTSDITTEDYFPYIAIASLGYWKLPNENIFPAYSISGIPIGTGDGETTNFTCPIGYFKKNTDKVYKNGVQLTRGVDYTVDNANNANKLQVVNELRGPVISKITYSGSMHNMSDYYAYMLVPTYNTPGDTNKLRCIEHNTPVYIEYTEPMTLNYMYAINVCATNTRHLAIPSGSQLKMEYSLDGEIYQEAGRYTVTSTSGTLLSFSTSFEPATAKYWRFTYVDSSDTSNQLIAYNATYGYPKGLYIGYSDPYIRFTEAPAAEDVLTMDVDMDVIFKNSNFVVDMQAEVSF